MFQSLKPVKSKSRASLAVSFFVHCFVVYVWLSRPPIFVQPSSVAWGLHGESENVIYFPKAAQQQSAKPKLQLQRKAKRTRIEPEKSAVEAARAGAPEGSMFRGPVTGVEAMPALPMFFPDPAVYSWQLPNGLNGDVIVEVTIDDHGNVTETRLLQSLKEDIDTRVIATLKSWRFRPATVDGIAISSRQDVHFHFPS